MGIKNGTPRDPTWILTGAAAGPSVAGMAPQTVASHAVALHIPLGRSGSLCNGVVTNSSVLLSKQSMNSS